MISSPEKGFTLIEIMIAIAIVGITLAIAIPSYNSHIQKTRRVEATTALVDLAAKLERYHTTNNTYVGATIPGLGVESPTPNGNYALSILSQTPNTYTIRATRVVTTAQANDACGDFTLTNTGAEGLVGNAIGFTNAICWRR